MKPSTELWCLGDHEDSDRIAAYRYADRNEASTAYFRSGLMLSAYDIKYELRGFRDHKLPVKG